MVCTEDTATYIMDCPLGEYALMVCSKGLHSVKQLILNDEEFCPNSERDIAIRSEEIDVRFAKILEEAFRWFCVYFADPQHIEICGLPVICADSFDDAFFANMWLVLASNIHAGQIISYGELATMLGCRGQYQAVRNGIIANPLEIIVPCHRVIPKSGKVGLYAGGGRSSVKEWLLVFEGCTIQYARVKSKELCDTVAADSSAVVTSTTADDDILIVD